MGGGWFEVLRPLAKEACLEHVSAHAPDVALFYLARWCQKTAGHPQPDLESLEGSPLRDVVERIVRNLSEDGERVERLVAGDTEEWTGLRRLLLASAWRRADAAAGEHAEEALQKIAVILLTGTPPSRAAEQLRRGPDGPANEYVFQSPFSFWAKAVVIHLVVDEQRRANRLARPPRPGVGEPGVDREELEKARDALPALVEALRALPPVQRSVMVLSLSRRDVDEVVAERLHDLAPDLFSETGEAVASDRDIADHLGTTARLVAANRSVARRKLARRDPSWALLLDVLLPHRSTRPIGRAGPRGSDG